MVVGSLYCLLSAGAYCLVRDSEGGEVFLGDLGYTLPLQIEKEEQAAAEKAVTKEEFQTEWTAPAPEFTAPPQPEVADWSEGVQVPSVPIQQFPTGRFGGCLWEVGYVL